MKFKDKIIKSNWGGQTIYIKFMQNKSNVPVAYVVGSCCCHVGGLTWCPTKALHHENVTKIPIKFKKLKIWNILIYTCVCEWVCVVLEF